MLLEWVSGYHLKFAGEGVSIGTKAHLALLDEYFSVWPLGFRIKRLASFAQRQRVFQRDESPLFGTVLWKVFEPLKSDP